MEEISSPTGTFKIRLASVVLDSSDSNQLADFYAALLQWQKFADDPEWIYVRNKENFPLIIFQKTDDYSPPVWPNTPNQQQTGAHMDFGVSNLKEAIEHAIKCGAQKADVQYSDHWTVMLDPAGHPFCLVEWKNLQ